VRSGASGCRGMRIPFAAPLAAEAALPHEAVEGGKSPSTRGATVRRRARTVRVESRSRQAASGPEKPSAVAAAEGGRGLARTGKPARAKRRRQPDPRWRHRGDWQRAPERLLGEGRRPGSSGTTALHGATGKAVSVVGQKASPQGVVGRPAVTGASEVQPSRGPRSGRQHPAWARVGRPKRVERVNRGTHR
jgi:hypothetical protein